MVVFTTCSKSLIQEKHHLSNKHAGTKEEQIIGPWWTLCEFELWVPFQAKCLVSEPGAGRNRNNYC